MPLNLSPIILWLLFAASIIAATLPLLTLLPRLTLIGNLVSRGPAAVGVMSYSKSTQSIYFVSGLVEVRELRPLGPQMTLQAPAFVCVIPTDLLLVWQQDTGV